MHRMILVVLCAALIQTPASSLSSAATASASPAPIAPVRARPDTATVHVGPADAGTGAFVAYPAGQRPAPAVIVIQEWWGLNDQIREIARRLAAQGYIAVAPDLYHGKVATDPELAHELSRALDTDAAVQDLENTVAWVRSQPRAAKTKLGTIGFCMGGGLSLQLALADSNVAAAVMFYGRPETDLAKLASLRAPLQGHFGATDQGITVQRVDEFRAALKKAGKNAEVFEYAGAGHAFMHEGLPSYHADAARQAWARTLAFYQKHLKS